MKKLPQKISTTTLQKLQKSDYILLDVRTTKEINQHKVEHPNYINIDFYADDFEKQLLQLDKDETYIIMCNSGGRSAITQEIMNKQGYTTTDVVGGIQDWMKKGYKTQKNTNACF